MTSRGRRVALAFGLALIAITAFAAPAGAASTRAEYVVQIEPICQSAKKPAIKTFTQVIKFSDKLGIDDREDLEKKQIKRKVRALTSRLYLDWAAIYGGVTERVAAVPPAPGDEGAIANWLDSRRTVTADLETAARAYKHGKEKLVKRIGRQADRAIAQANALGRNLALPLQCAPSDGNLFEFD
jgi:hypothetical protein